MNRFFPLVLTSVAATAGFFYMLMEVPPDNYVVEATFFVLAALGIAGWGSLGIYFLRKKWGPKDSPKFVWRVALKDGLILGIGVVVLLVLNVFGDLTWVTGLAILGLAIVVERLL